MNLPSVISKEHIDLIVDTLNESIDNESNLRGVDPLKVGFAFFPHNAKVFGMSINTSFKLRIFSLENPAKFPAIVMSPKKLQGVKGDLRVGIGLNIVLKTLFGNVYKAYNHVDPAEKIDLPEPHMKIEFNEKFLLYINRVPGSNIPATNFIYEHNGSKKLIAPLDLYDFCGEAINKDEIQGGLGELGKFMD